MKPFCLPGTSSIHWFFVPLYLALLLLPLRLPAQTIYPVQSSLQLLPPYSVYLSDYAQPGAEKLRVILLQRDLSQAAYSLRLVFSVERNGRVILRTSRLFNPPPLPLDPGIPTVVSGADLAPYLDSRNLDFVGYSREQYERTRSLPEGSYRICVSAYDYRRPDVPVAAEACNSYFLAKSEPPLVNYPACGAKIPARPVQQVVFSWLPRNTASANSVATTAYEFSLFEVRPAGRNVNDLVLTSRPVYQVTTDYAQLVYGAGEPTLQEGMPYAWRVQAKDQDGKDLFRNNGYSEVCSFTYGGVDPAFVVGAVRDFKAQAQAERKATLSWQVDQKGFEGYRVEYKKTGVGYEWFKNDTKEGELKIFDLEPDTEYEARVQGQVKGVYGPYSEVVTFRTPKQRVVACGENQPVAQLQQGKPLPFATPGMSIQARGMEVILEEVEHLPEDGFYKGTGRVKINYLGGAAFAIKFDRIYIDEDRNVVSGRIDVVSNNNQMTEIVAWAAEAFKPLTDKLDDLLTKLKEPQDNKEQIATAIDDYIDHVQAFIEKNPQLPDSVQQQLREDALLLETSKGGFLAATDQATTGMIIATIGQQVEQAKDRIAAVQAAMPAKETPRKGDLPFRLAVHVCDSLMKDNKAYFSSRNNCKLYATLETKDSTIHQATLKLTISIADSKAKLAKTYTIDPVNKKQQLAIDSLPEGKYELQCTANGKTLTQTFYVRKHRHEYACSVCGSNLAVTLDKLRLIFPNNDKVTSQDATWFNEALKKAGFNTCKKQVHFFSQVHAETGEFTKFIEDPSYRPYVFLSTFDNNCNLKSLFNQHFWDSKEYKKYFSFKVYELDTISKATKYKAINLVTYKWAPNPKSKEAYCKGIFKEAKDTIRIPTDFTLPKKGEKGAYVAVNFTEAQKQENQDRLMSITYANRSGNGSAESHDGYIYRGRGAVHLTFRGSYREVSKVANKVFGTNFNWETNYEQLEKNKQEIIYSGVAFFLWKLNYDLSYLQNNNCTSVSIKVNGGDNGLDKRKAAVNALIKSDLFDCVISKE